jgi:hypothetical protein
MKCQYYDIGSLKGGEIVEVRLSGNAANVRLMDSSNYCEAFGLIPRSLLMGSSFYEQFLRSFFMAPPKRRRPVGTRQPERYAKRPNKFMECAASVRRKKN